MQRKYEVAAMQMILRALAAGLLVVSTNAANAGESIVTKPVVVELFTSQGCSSCPPANANLAALSTRPGVIALSFGVTYWNYLGWKDTFAQPGFTQRQRDYARALGHEGPFTPQIVVNGAADTVGNVRADVIRLIDDARPRSGPQIVFAPDSLSVAGGLRPTRPADIWLVRYDSRIVQVPVQRGENAGVTLPHKNVVRDLEKLGQWDGARETLVIPPAPGGISTAILVQEPNGGAIISAARE
jgi:hypothetical protein